MKISLRADKAFTLVELLVVVLIVGILLALLVPSFLGQTQKAQDSVVQQQLSVIRKTLKGEWLSGIQEVGYPAQTSGELVAILEKSEPQYKFVAFPAPVSEETISVQLINTSSAVLCSMSATDARSVYCFKTFEDTQATMIAQSPPTKNFLSRVMSVEQAYAASPSTSQTCWARALTENAARSKLSSSHECAQSAYSLSSPADESTVLIAANADEISQWIDPGNPANSEEECLELCQSLKQEEETVSDATLDSPAQEQQLNIELENIRTDLEIEPRLCEDGEVAGLDKTSLQIDDDLKGNNRMHVIVHYADINNNGKPDRPSLYKTYTLPSITDGSAELVCHEAEYSYEDVQWTTPEDGWMVKFVYWGEFWSEAPCLNAPEYLLHTVQDMKLVKDQNKWGCEVQGFYRPSDESVANREPYQGQLADAKVEEFVAPVVTPEQVVEAVFSGKYPSVEKVVHDKIKKKP